MSSALEYILAFNPALQVVSVELQKEELLNAWS